MSGEEVDVNDWLIEAAGEDDTERARNYSNRNGESFFDSSKPLHLAVEGYFFSICKFLIEKRGFDINELNSDGQTPLHLACWASMDDREEMAKIVKLLLNNGANSSISGPNFETPLHIAVKKGWKEVVKILLKAGIDINIDSIDGSRPLHYASVYGRKDVVEILCQNGANVNAENDAGWTPLHEAAYCATSESAEIIETLLKFGANINAQGAYMETALHCACPCAVIEIASVLLDNGCDVNIETSSRKTALDTMIAVAKNKFAVYSEKETINILSGMYDDFGTLDDDDDFEPDALQSVQILKQHLVKLKAAQLFVSEKNLSHLKNSNFSDFEEQCQQEISAAKNEELHHGVTLFNILSAGVNPTYAKNKPLMEALDCCNWDSFPLYKCIILNNIKKSTLRHHLLESGEKWLGILLRTSSVLNEFLVPAEIMSTDILPLIVSFLSNEELEALITCGNELQRQLVRNSSDIPSSTS